MSRAAVPVRFGDQVRPVAAVAFDKDGTLTETLPFWDALFGHCCDLIAEVAGAQAAEQWATEMGAPGGRYDRRGPFAVGPRPEEIILTAGLLYRRMGWPWSRCRDTASAIMAEADRRLDLRAVAVPRRGAVELVRSLKAAGVAVGVVTSDDAGRASQVLSLVGLPPETWDFFLTPESVQRPKPAPDMVLAACAAAGCAPEALAVVGDAAVDMQMARAAGAFGVAVPEDPADIGALAPYADVVLAGPHAITIKE